MKNLSLLTLSYLLLMYTFTFSNSLWTLKNKIFNREQETEQNNTVQNDDQPNNNDQKDQNTNFDTVEKKQTEIEKIRAMLPKELEPFLCSDTMNHRLRLEIAGIYRAFFCVNGSLSERERTCICRNHYYSYDCPGINDKRWEENIEEHVHRLVESEINPWEKSRIIGEAIKALCEYRKEHMPQVAEPVPSEELIIVIVPQNLEDLSVKNTSENASEIKNDLGSEEAKYTPKDVAFSQRLEDATAQDKPDDAHNPYNDRED